MAISVQNAQNEEEVLSTATNSTPAHFLSTRCGGELNGANTKKEGHERTQSFCTTGQWKPPPGTEYPVWSKLIP